MDAFRIFRNDDARRGARKAAVELRQPFLLGLHHFRRHGADFVRRQTGGGERIESACPNDGFWIAAEGGFDGKSLYGNIAVVQCGKLRRQIADVGRMEACSIRENRHFLDAGGG